MTLRLYKEELKYTTSDPSEKRAAGDDPVPAKSHSSRHVPDDVRTINGWGADLDPKNRPMVPRELPSDVRTVRGNVGARQVPTAKVHVSIEQPDLTPVFGNSCPPHGLSGMIRDYAYQFGEGANRHWMTLVLADRVDMFEHLIGDVFRGKPDRYFKEKGFKANFKHEPERAWMYVGALALGAIAVGAIVANRRR